MLQNNGRRLNAILIPAFSLLITGLLAVVLISVMRGSDGAAAQITATVQPESTAVVVETAVPTESDPTATPVPDHSTVCPQPDASTQLFISEDNGYCFLYPAGFKIGDRFDISVRDVTLLAPQHDGSEVYFFIRVMYRGSASDFASPQAYAETWRQIHLVSGSSPVMEDSVIGNQPAVIMPNIWQMAFLDTINRTAFIVANEQKYRIAMAHWASTNGNGLNVVFEAEAQQAWDTITNSIVFFPPAKSIETVQAADVCPPVQDGSNRYISEWMGVCFLYPADFYQSPNNLYALTNAADDTEWGVPQLSVAFSGLRTEEGAKLGDVITVQEYQEFIGEGLIQGYETLSVIDKSASPGPIYVTYIGVGEYIYQVWMTPYDDEHRSDLDRIWQQVRESIVFFTPVW